MRIQSVSNNYQNKQNFKGAIKLQDTEAAKLFISTIKNNVDDFFLKYRWYKDMSINFFDKKLEKQAINYLDNEGINYLYLKKNQVSDDEFEKFVNMDYPC